MSETTRPSSAIESLAAAFAARGKKEMANLLVTSVQTPMQAVSALVRQRWAQFEDHVRKAEAYGDWRNAVAFQRTVVNYTARSYGSNHLQVLEGLLKLAYLLRRDAALLEAQAVVLRVERLSKATVGDNHPIHAQIAKQLGAIERSMDRARGASNLALFLNVACRQAASPVSN